MISELHLFVAIVTICSLFGLGIFFKGGALYIKALRLDDLKEQMKGLILMVVGSSILGIPLLI
jgi:uncharacterized membrane protein YqiK